MTNKSEKFPRCPWCGAEMKADTGDVFRTDDDGWVARLSCDECGANSSFVYGKTTKEEAVNALRELKPKEEPNRVLTLGEVKDAYFNMKKPICCELMWLNKKKIAWIADAAVPWGNVAHIMERQEPKWKDYGKTWRCWLCNPTDEERAATPWEGEKDDDD